MPSSFARLETVLHSAERGTTIITANTRGARALLRAYDERQHERGLAAWCTPHVVSWGGFLLGLWNEALYGGLTGGLVLLNPAQERRFWQSIVESDGRQLLNPAATAANAQAAWELAREYCVPIGGAMYEVSPEAAAFASWAAEFENECKARGWLASAALADVLVTHVRAGRLPAKKLVLVGFDEFTPQQKVLIDALVTAGADCDNAEYEMPSTGHVCRVSAADSNAEIRAAAIWARELLQAEPSPEIAVLVPSLQSLRARVESIFLATLHPEQLVAGKSERTRAFEISLGVPLSETPIICAALLLLKLCLGTVSLAEAGAILRSPFLSGGESEMTKRAQLDVLLRKNRVLEISARELIERASGRCAILAERLRKMVGTDTPAARALSPRDWGAVASAILETMGWPEGERSLNSDEYQAVESWTELLSQFGSLEAVEPMMDARRFLTALGDCAASKLFEPEKSGAPVQIMGLLEAAGSTFDHMWIMGLHDGAWPMRSPATPFIPTTLQLKHDVPHSSSQKELEFAERVRKRLLRTAGQIVLSYPQKDGDAELRRSPLIADVPERKLDEVIGGGPASWSERLLESCTSESLEDEQGPPIAAGSLVKGGTKILERQSACPFRAFAELRLGAVQMDSPQPGLDGMQRGNIIHKAMEFVWRRLKTRDALLACEPLRDVVYEAVGQAIQESRASGTAEWERTLAEIERERVTELVLDFLEIEKARDPFTVTAEEQKRTVPVGTLQMEIRMDRIDHLADGRQLLIDYKTGEVSTRTWEGERPEAPQLPAYAATAEGEIAAVAFAQIKAGSVGFCGYSPDLQVLDTGDYGKTAPGAAGKKMKDVVADWKSVIERLAIEHREGRAEVDPAKGKETCRYCPIPALCRFSEAQLTIDVEGDDEE